MLTEQRGSGALEAIVGILFLLILGLGAIEVAFTLYARNVVANAAHEAARVAVESDSTSVEAERIGERMLSKGAGGLVHSSQLSVSIPRATGWASVRVRAVVDVPGPLPLHVPMSFEAHAFHESPPA